MLIDRTHRSWFFLSLFVLLLAICFYVPYSLLSVSGPSGGSAAGLAYGILGFAMMLFAGLLGARKKIPTWRVGRATWWMRAHLWIGFVSYPFILFHAGFRMGNGSLTRLLMLLFTVVFVSGIFGAALQNFMPRVMTQRVNMETIYQQIDRITDQLLQESAQIVSDLCSSLELEMTQLEEMEQTGPPKMNRGTIVSSTRKEDVAAIQTFYIRELKPFLSARGIPKHILANRVRGAEMFQQLRVLAPQSMWQKLDDLENICEEKRQIETQRRLHKILHGWLLVHIPASYALLVFGAVHAVVALRF